MSGSSSYTFFFFTVKAKKNIIIVLRGKDNDYISAPKPLFSQSWSGVEWINGIIYAHY